MWTFDGWTYLAFSGGEARNPRRSLPIGLIAGLITVSVVYLATNAAYFVALTPDELLGDSPVVTAAVAKLMGPDGRRLIAALVTLSIFGSLTAMFLTGTRCMLAMASDGLLPSRLGQVHPVLRTPLLAVAFQAAIAVALPSAGGFFEILAISFIADWIFKGALIATVIVVRRRTTSPSSSSSTSYRVPGYPWLPLGFCACAAGLVLLAIAAEPRSALLGALLILSGVPVFLLVRRNRRKKLSVRTYVLTDHADLRG